MEELILNGERVFLNKSRLGWKVVKPIKIDGRINWKNFIAGGNWWNLLLIAFVITIILGCIWEYSIALKTANHCLATCPYGRI